ncbi:MAG TPA: protein kinase [Chloroflexia bacterium]|nr:protein kinase [Chloroflexia bacterium]
MSWQEESISKGKGSYPEVTPSGLERSPSREIKTLGDGRYRIINLSGRGGMSQVYHAYDTQNDRDVAIKVLSLELSSEENFLARFQRESELMRDLDHPNILRAYDYGQEEDKVYLVMSYFGGGTLKERIGPGKLNLAQIADYLSQIASGLGYAHSRNIVHRDVKPSNVLIHHSGDNLVLSDFGIAKALSNSNPNRTGTIMGTPLYMAPEQFLDRVDKRSDIYSLGVLLYQLLTGEVPFKGDGIGFKHLSDPVPPMRTWGFGYDPSIERVVLKALAKRPEARFQTAEELAEAFREAVESFASSQTIDSRGSGPGLTGQANAQWMNIEDNPAVLPGQASLSELPVIRQSQLKTEPAEKSEAGAIPLQKTEPIQISSYPEIQAKKQVKPEPTEVNTSSEHLATTRLALPYMPLDKTYEAVPDPRTLEMTRRAAEPAIARPGNSRTRKTPRFWFLILSLIVVTALAAGAGAYLLANASSEATRTAVAGQTGNLVPGSHTDTPAVTTAPAVITAAPIPTVLNTQLPGPVLPSPRVVFTSIEEGTNSTYIWTYEAKTGALTRLTDTGRDSLPVWSPDGGIIVFQRNKGGETYDIYSMYANGNALLPVVTDAHNPAFAHNTNRIVYISEKDNELYLKPVDGSQGPATKLTSTSGRPKIGPAWSYDDNRIAFAMEDDNRVYQIYVLNLNDLKAPLLKLTSFPDENALWPSFSPDGQFIVFSTNDNNPNIAARLPQDIYVTRSDGNASAPTMIVGNYGHNSHPVWVADKRGKMGSRIYFNSDRGVPAYARIYVMDPDGSNQQIYIPRKDNQSDSKIDDYAPSIFLSSN